MLSVPPAPYRTLWFLFPPGGCHKDDSGEQQGAITEEQASVDGLTTAAIISEDPHAVLVEFSSVVADTQEYIIKVRATGWSLLLLFRL